MCTAATVGQSITLNANVTFAEINEIISITCMKPNDPSLTLFFPEPIDDKVCRSSSIQQCTRTGICETTSSVCSCCVKPITSSCNASSGQLSFTVLMINQTFFGNWSCSSLVDGACASIFIQQFGNKLAHVYSLFLDNLQGYVTLLKYSTMANCI